MNKLDLYDLSWAVNRLPKFLKDIMMMPKWQNKIYVGGGYLRSIVSGEPINDVDIFVGTKENAEQLSLELCKDKNDIIRTDNAITIKGKLPLQIIHRWLFDKPEDVANSFDFSICCAVISYSNGSWQSYCDERFYIDLSSKRLVYRRPIRNEDAGGSMLRVLKYYQKGYRIPLNSLGDIIARLVKGYQGDIKDEEQVGKVITGLLKEVDPSVDPLHTAHLPSII